MAKKKQKNKQRQIGKSTIEKKPLINPKYMNTVWTVLILIVLLIFFIINNTRKETEQGPYPPGYKPEEVETNTQN